MLTPQSKFNRSNDAVDSINTVGIRILRIFKIGLFEGCEECQDFATHKSPNPVHPKILTILILLVGCGRMLKIPA
jgi:hypothetical protein